MQADYDRFVSLLDPAGVRAALIDMDGTLYDSMPHHADAWMHLMRDMGIDARREEFFLYEGSTGAAVIDHMMRRHKGRPATPQEMKDGYAAKSRYFAGMPRVEPVPGARELVDALLARGIVTVLVTGSGQHALLDRLAADFPGAFPEERRVTSASVRRGKPAPDPYLRGLEIAGVPASRAIAIDNAPLGTASGHAAGIPTVGVVTGPIPQAELAANGADIVFNSMPLCAEILPQLL